MKELIVRFLKKILATADREVMSFAVHKWGRSFYLSAMNTRSAVKRIKQQFNFDKTSGLFFIKSASGIRFFGDRSIGLAFYGNGIKERVLYLTGTYFLNSINFEENDLIVDVGANIGDFHLALQSKGVSLQYVGFEPAPIEFECLRRNCAYELLHNIALSDFNGTTQFYISSQNGDSSLITPSKFSELIRCETRTIDSFNFNQVKLLKLEAEGAELEVLKGSIKTLREIEYIAADLGPERLGKCTLPEVTNFLLKNSFDMIEFNEHRTTALFHNNSFKS